MEATDAQLGIHSTVPTDDVIAGTSVARPVDDAESLRAAATVPLDRARLGARAALLADRVVSGPAGAQFASGLEASIAR